VYKKLVVYNRESSYSDRPQYKTSTHTSLQTRSPITR